MRGDNSIKLQGSLFEEIEKLRESINKTSRNKQSFDDEFFTFFKSYLSSVDMQFSESTFDEVPHWLRKFETNYYKQTLDLFHCFVDSCEVIRNFNVACSIVRSIADRMGVAYLLFMGINSDEKELRCLLYILDSLDNALKLQENNDAMMKKFSTVDFLMERRRYLNERITKCTELISGNNVILKNQYSVSQICKLKNWKYKNSPMEKMAYTWKELYNHLPYNKIPGISKHYEWLSQNVHGLYSSTFEPPKDSPLTYHVPVLYALNLLTCFSKMIECRGESLSCD